MLGIDQFVTTAFEGQLANRVFTLFKLIVFAGNHALPADALIINASESSSGSLNPRKYGNYAEPNFLLHRQAFFKGVSYMLLTQEEWDAKTKDIDFVEPLGDVDQLLQQGKSLRLNNTMMYPITEAQHLLFGKSFFNIDLFQQAQLELQVQHINSSKTVAIHIRRGDFKEYHGGQFLQSADVVNQRIAQVSPEKDVLIFSDDISWCKQHLVRVMGGLFFNEPGTDVQDIMRMTCCTDVLPNEKSAFSRLGKVLCEYAKLIDMK